MINTVDKGGGLTFVHIRSFMNSSKSIWISRYCDNTAGPWKQFFDIHLVRYGETLLFRCNILPNDIMIDNEFIREAVHGWCKASYKVPSDQFGNQILWNNSHLKIDNETKFYRRLYNNGIVYVHDLFNENGIPLDFNSFRH